VLVMLGMVTLQAVTDPMIAEQLRRIALAQTFIAVAAGIVLLLLIGAALISYGTLRSAARLLKALEKVAEEMVPRMDPLIEKLTRIADDANDVSDSLRRKVHEATTTLEEVNLAMRRGARETERRVREFGAVLEVVQEEAESLLLDAASTARGVHTTAATLRDRRAASGSGIPPADGRGLTIRTVARETDEENP
jgi:methyl-accepting chemotaxis protein